MTTVGWVVYGILVFPAFVLMMALFEGVSLRGVWAALRRGK